MTRGTDNSKAKSMRLHEAEWIGTAAVSYTHLDVYKRQVISTTNTNFFIKLYNTDHLSEFGMWLYKCKDLI